MLTEDALRKRLAQLDPQFAPQEFTSMDARNRDALLIAIRLTPAKTVAGRKFVMQRTRRRRGWTVVGALFAVSAAAAGVLLVSGSGSVPRVDYSVPDHVSLASWTRTPASVTATTAEESACAIELYGASYDPSTMTTSAADQRGDFTSFIVTSGGVPGYCVLFDGHVEGYDRMTVANEMSVAASTLAGTSAIVSSIGFVDLFSSSTAPSGAQGMAIADGFAGSDVTSVVLHFDRTGENVDATVAGGYWTAWWPQSVDTSRPGDVPPSNPATATPLARIGSLEASITYTTADGVTHDASIPQFIGASGTDSSGTVLTGP